MTQGSDGATATGAGETETRTILIVDDDQALGEMLSIVLENEGFRTVTCLDGLRAVEVFPLVRPDLILLDVMLPGLDGVGVARAIRETSNVPIIMLTAKSDTQDVVAGLEAGADDYVAKPFKVVELLARIRARFRIAAPANGAGVGANGGSETVGANGTPSNRIERGRIVIDRLEHTATKDGCDLALTPMEFQLLFELASNAGEAISRASLLKRVWGYDNAGDTRLVNVHVQRLRAKVETDPENPRIVQTVRGIGYKFVTPELG
ncbi:MtrAB system response regulator MtrA [Bifidobacterium amazonense]|uniref:DNA-binding response regulator MtrA n=1 Tax=Bifidobacterium amazonense TaxID=2809027 RepID=A0ABS9VSM2_9BIFI|nr:MtrAB system response regulator MtrA [Bifidobacterium amazonense]MCH9275086.1 MtrAB system response regulator MtrA [Bifidobacterium amazonense]